MPAIQDLLRQLGRDGVTELALSSGRLPCVKEDGMYVPVAQQAVSDAELLEALKEAGAGPAVNALGDKPLSWALRIPGLGTIKAVAVRRGVALQARFVLTARDANAAAVGATAPPAPRPSATPGPRVTMTSEVDAAPPSTTATANGTASTKAKDDLGEIALELDLDGGRITGNPTAVARRTPPSGVRAVDPRAQTAAIEEAPRSAPILGEVGLSEALAALLSAARTKDASDVHLVADRLPTFRLAGALVPQGGYVSATQVAAMLEPIVPRRLRDAFERTGSCDFAIQDRTLGRFRVNVSRQRSGLKGCFRLVSHEVPQLTTLGLPASLTDATRHHQGLILVTGPTGSGKSTTMAALVDILNRETSHHIITIEDPIEHLHTPKKALLSQREVGSHTKSFANALKASLREDPDVIVVGELRDTETVRMALTASETGHLVIATMNTPSAAKTIERLIDLFPTSDQGQVRMTLAGGLRLIVGQRLVPSLQGGMVAVAETLPGCVPLWSLIRENRTFQIPSLQQRGKQLGILRLDDQLADLVRGGRISMEAARFFAESPDFGAPPASSPGR